MAVRFNGTASNALSSTTFVFDYNAGYTVVCPVYLTVDRNAVSTLWCVTDGTANNRDALRTSSSGTIIQMNVVVATAATSTGAFDCELNRLYTTAIVRRSVTALDLYIDSGLRDATNTRDVTGRAAASRIDLGQERATTNPLDGRIPWLKIWTAVLTVNEIIQEMRCIEPIRRTNLFGWWTFPAGAARIQESSVNNRHWTSAGTITDEDMPITQWRRPQRLPVPMTTVSVPGQPMMLRHTLDRTGARRIGRGTPF